MITIYDQKKVNIRWEVFKTVNNVHEDFSQAEVWMFLIADEHKYPLHTALDGNFVTATIDGGAFAPGSYSAVLMWLKNPETSKDLTRTRLDNIFALTPYEDEDTSRVEGDVTVTLKSMVATYGYDGLDAYERAIMLGRFWGSEEEWMQSLGDHDLANYYTKGEVDELIDNVEVDLTDYYTKGQTDAKIDEAAGGLRQAVQTNTDDIALAKADITDLQGSTDSMESRVTDLETDMGNFVGLNQSNYKGMFSNVNSLPSMTEIGWAWVGDNMTSMAVYVWFNATDGWTRYGSNSYDLTDYSGVASQLATIGSKIGDLTELETTDKTDLVSAINEVKNNASTTAEDTSYEDNYGIGADNVQEAIDKVGFVGEDTEIDLTQYTEQRAWISASAKWLVSSSVYPYYGIFVPVNAGEKYKIVGNAANASYYAFMKSYAVGSHNASVTTFATGASRIEVGAGQTVVDTAPSDAICMWIGTTMNASGDVIPQKVEIPRKSTADCLADLQEDLDDTEERVDGLYDALKTDQSQYLGNWRTSDSSKSPIVVGEDNSCTFTCGTGGRVGFEVSNVADGAELHISFHYEKTAKSSGSWGIGSTMTATWATIVPVSGSVLIGEPLSGDCEFSFIVPSGVKFIYLSAPNFRGGQDGQTVTISNLKAWTEQTLSEKFDSLEAEQRIPSTLTQYSYYGEKINIPSANHLAYINYMTLSCSRMSDNYYQGAACYGDYLFVGGANGYELDIYNLSEKAFVQHIEITGKEPNENDHMNTLFFSNEFHTSGDDFPLLYSCSGYAVGGVNYVHGYRIVKSSSEETFTAELVHTITLNFGEWTDAVCDMDYGFLWIRTGGNAMTFYKYSMPSYTSGDVTLSPNSGVVESFSIPTQEFGVAYPQGFLFHEGHIYYTSGNGAQAGGLHLTSINTRTRCRATDIDIRAIGLTQEPESCVIYNGHLCIVYNTKLVMFYFD